MLELELLLQGQHPKQVVGPRLGVSRMAVQQQEHHLLPWPLALFNLLSAESFEVMFPGETEYLHCAYRGLSVDRLLDSC